MMMKAIVLLLTGVLLLTSCLRQSSKDEAVIHGKLKNGAWQKVVLMELEPAGAVPVDSVILGGDGSFSMAFRPAETGFYLLRKPDGKQVVIVTGKGDKIGLDGDYKRLPEGVTVTGSGEAVLLNGFYEYSSHNKAVADSLQKFLGDHQYDANFAGLAIRTDSLFRKIWEEQRAYEVQFLNDHPSSFSSLLVLNFSFGVRPVLSPEDDLPYYIKVDSALSVSYPANKQVLFNKKRIQEFRMQKALKPGPEK